MDEDGSYEVTNYAFKLIPKEKINPITFEMDISATKHQNLRPEAEVFTIDKVFLTVKNKKYEIVASTINLSKHINDDDYLRTYQLREYTKPFIINVKPNIYNKFEKGNYLDIETYCGLFGIAWTYYR